MDIYFNDCSINIYDKVILSHVTFNVLPGIFYRIGGKNGSGKTILLNALLGLNKHIEGEHGIQYNKEKIAYIPDSPFFLDSETVQSAINTLCFFYNKQKSDIISILNDLDLDYHTIKHDKIVNLSKGMKKKICIVPLFFDDITCYVLDEIFTGLDSASQFILQQRLIELNRQQKTIIMVEHNESIINDIKKHINMEEYVCENGTLTYKPLIL